LFGRNYLNDESAFYRMMSVGRDTPLTACWTPSALSPL
jgi:hypothetical protein